MQALNSMLNSTLAQEAFRSWMLPDPDSSFAAHVDKPFMFITWICLIFFFPMMGLMVYFVVKYRRREGVAQQRSPAHHTAIELTWTIGPLFLLGIMFVWGFKGYLFFHVAPSDAEQIDLQAMKWNWTMTYDTGTQSAQTISIADKEVPVFPVPAGKPVKLTMHSTDVIHSFFVPDFRVKLDVFPNRYTTMWFQPTVEPELQADGSRYSDHLVFCTEYCGDGHSQMGAVIRVMPKADYDAWKNQPPYNPDVDPPHEIGEILYRVKGCNACHSVDGAANVGPTWQGVFGSARTFSNAPSAMADENYIRESILDPAAKLVAGFPNQMVSYQGQLTEQEIDWIIAYIKTLATQD
ncbi:MAG: c-type cytochrome [Phycisphaerales bacterium JB043]